MWGITLLEQLLALTVALSLLTYSVRHWLAYTSLAQQALLRTDLHLLQQQARNYFYQQGCDIRGRFRGKTRPELSALGLPALASGRAPWVARYQVELNLQAPLWPNRPSCRALLHILVTLTPTGQLNRSRVLNSLSGKITQTATQLDWQQLLIQQRPLLLSSYPQYRVL